MEIASFLETFTIFLQNQKKLMHKNYCETNGETFGFPVWPHFFDVTNFQKLSENEKDCIVFVAVVNQNEN